MKPDSYLADSGQRKLVRDAVEAGFGCLISIDIPNCRNGSVKSMTSSLPAVTVIGATAISASCDHISWKKASLPL